MTLREKEFKAIVALRRDPEEAYNFDNIPYKGEVNFVELESGEVKVKIGDGKTKFRNLPYADARLQKKIESIVVRGYYYEGRFYEDYAHSVLLSGKEYTIYIDVDTSKVYSYNGIAYELLSDVPYASSEMPGIMKLYNSLGSNIDGACTQKVTTEELKKKPEVTLRADGTLVFNYNY